MTELACSACGEANPERARFCLACGTPLKRPAEAEAAGRPTRRTVTVVFSDLAGFTALSETLDQESLRGVMDGFYARMRAAVEGERGTVAKFIGDAVLAVWGAREVEEDDALRAVRAAEAMRTAMAGLNEELLARWGVEVAMRTGVHTGEVVVDPAQGVDLLVGDTVNVAARLEQAAGAGEVLVGPATARLVRDHVTLAAGEPLALKGKARPLAVWRLVDGTAPSRDATPRRDTPFVGRAEPLARLEAALADAEATGRTRLATVVGSPGVGKSRLVAEFVRGAAGRARVLHGRCERTGEGATLLPIAEVVRAAAGIGEHDDAATVAARLDAVLPAAMAERDRVAAVAAAVLGSGDATAAAGEELFWGVRRLLEALAAERPVVVVVDDVHWAQPTLLDLLEHLADWGREGAVLVVALARPELRDTRPALTVAGGRIAAALALEPLGEAASAALVDELLGSTGLPDALARRILDTTEGNPLFLSEMVRMLVDDGVLTPDGDGWSATGADAAEIAVPPTIHALLGARLERLGSDERVVVERASVVGQEFWRGAVAELAPEPVRAGIDGHLDGLGRKELVDPMGMAFGDEPAFRFHHALIRDAAYRALLKQARAELHERVAGWLERRAPGQDEVVAFHLERAHGYLVELGPLDEAGLALATRAAARLHVAGARALEREDLPAAQNLLARAVRLLPADDVQRGALLLQLAEALLSAGDTAAAEPVVEDLAGLGDERHAAWAVALRGQLATLGGAGDVAGTIAASEDAAQRLQRLGDRAGEAKAWQVAGQAQAMLGRVGAAEAALDRALVAARDAGDERRVRSVLAGAPQATLWGPSPVVRASGRCLDVVRILRMTPGSPHLQVAAQRCGAVLEAMRGRADAAREVLDRSRPVLEELGLSLALAELDGAAGIVELLGDEPAAASVLLARARDGFVALGADGGAAQSSALLARALLEQDRIGEAEEATRVAEQRGGEDLKTAIAWRGVRAEALARRGEHAAALVLAEAAVSLAEPTDALADRGDALLALAYVRAAAGDPGGAAEAAARAAAAYGDKGHLVGVARAGRLTGDRAASASGDAGAPDAVVTGPSVAAAQTRRLLAHLAAGDVDALRDLYAPDVVGVDHRPGRVERLDREGMLDLVREVADGEPGPVLADGGGVFARVLLGPEAGPVAHVVRVTDGVEDRLDVFDADALPAVLRRFEELRFERGGGGAVAQVYGRFCAAFQARDWEGLHALHAPDLVSVDHRSLTLDTAGGADDFVRYSRTWTELVPDASMALTRIVDDRGDAAAVVMSAAGSGPGGPVRVDFAFVATVRDGRLAQVEVFSTGADEEPLRARLDELAGEVRPRTAFSALVQGVARAFNERDWDAYRALFAEHYVAEDRRAVGWPPIDLDVEVGQMQQLTAVAEDARVAMDVPLAEGDGVGVVVTRGSGTGPDGGRIEMDGGQVMVHRDGAIERAETFEPEDEAGMLGRYAELHAERARHPAERALAAHWRAVNLRDWDAVAAAFPPGATVIDHRTPGDEPVTDGAGSLALLRSWVALVPDATGAVTHVLATRPNAAAVVARGLGHGPDGGTFAVDVGTLVVVADGRIAHAEQFDPSAVDAMLARLDELAPAA